MGNQILKVCQTQTSVQRNSIQDQSEPQTGIISSHTQIERPHKSEQVELMYNKIVTKKPLKFQKNIDKSEKFVDFILNGQKAIFVGQFFHNQPSGYGEVYFLNGKYLQGIFVQGQVSCQDGIMIFNDHSYYRGSFQKSKFNGKGFLYVHNKYKIKSNFVNGYAKGKGQKIYIDNNSIYTGQIKYNRAEGRGSKIWLNETYYDGYFIKDQMQGLGYFRTNKYEYWGPFLKGKKNGKGTIKFKDGRHFQGWFKHDQIDGYCELEYPNGKVQKGHQVDINI